MASKNNQIKSFLSDLEELITINSNLEENDAFFNNIKEIEQDKNKLIISFKNKKAIQITVEEK